MKSAGPRAARSKKCCEVAGTASSERWTRDERGLTTVNDMADLSRLKPRGRTPAPGQAMVDVGQ